MTLEQFRAFCIGKPGVEEGLPFGPDTLVFKVGGKMFALTGIDSFDYINLKCDPERALELREVYEAIRPGYHMSKKHWNSVYMDGTLNDQFILELTDHSYKLVFNSLPKKVRQELE